MFKFKDYLLSENIGVAKIERYWFSRWHVQVNTFYQIPKSKHSGYFLENIKEDPTRLFLEFL